MPCPGRWAGVSGQVVVGGAWWSCRCALRWYAHSLARCTLSACSLSRRPFPRLRRPPLPSVTLTVTRCGTLSLSRYVPPRRFLSDASGLVSRWCALVRARGRTTGGGAGGRAGGGGRRAASRCPATELGLGRSHLLFRLVPPPPHPQSAKVLVRHEQQSRYAAAPSLLLAPFDRSHLPRSASLVGI